MKMEIRFAIAFVLIVVLAFPTYAFSLTGSENNVGDEAQSNVNNAVASPISFGDDGSQVSGTSLSGVSLTATPSVDITRLDDGILLNQSVPVGGNHDDIKARITDTIATSVTWISENTSIFTVTGDENQAIVSAVSEGCARLELKVATVSDGTLTNNKTFISVYTPINPNVKGSVKTVSRVYRSADDQSTFRGMISSGLNVSVVGICGNYYYIHFENNSWVTDGGPALYGYINKSALNIPVTSVTLTTTNKKLKSGETTTLKAIVKPDIATDKTVIWSSKSTKVAAVNGGGQVKYVAKGDTVVTVKSRSQPMLVASAKINCLSASSQQVNVAKAAFKELKVSWSALPSVNGYSIERYNAANKTWTVAYDTKSNPNILSFIDQGLAVGTSYSYRVRSYTITGGNTVYGAYSDISKGTTNKLSAIAADDKVLLSWGAGMSEIINYEVYQYNSSNKTSKKLSTLKGAVVEYIVTGLSAKKDYQFFVKPIYKAATPAINGGNSNTVSVKTKSVTDGYFFDQIYITKNWPNINYTEKKASKKAMNNFTLNGAKSSVKYNYSAKDDTLYIHLYFKVKGAGAKKKFEYYEATVVNGQVVYRTTGKKASDTYCQLAIKGFKVWNIKEIKGNTNDFKNGVKFNTKIVLHEIKKKDKTQKFITLRIGAGKKSKLPIGSYWHYVNYAVADPDDSMIDSNSRYVAQYAHLSGKIRMTLSTQKQTAELNKGKVYWNFETSPKAYSYVAAHELGHVLGINDAYEGRSVNGKEVDKSIMQGRVNNVRTNCIILANDIEMMLNAQGKATKWYAKGIKNETEKRKHPTWQSYKTYTENGNRYIISEVIRSK